MAVNLKLNCLIEFKLDIAITKFIYMNFENIFLDELCGYYGIKSKNSGSYPIYTLLKAWLFSKLQYNQIQFCNQVLLCPYQTEDGY